MDQIKIGKFIAQLRKAQGLTQSQLAEKLNISNRTVSKWETGNGLPDVSLLTPLCSVLNITSDELFAGEKRPEPHTEEVISAEIPKKSDKRKIIVIIIAVVLVIALCLLATCHFMGNGNDDNGAMPIQSSTPQAASDSITPTILTTETPYVTNTPENFITPDISLSPEVTVGPITTAPILTPPLLEPTVKPTQTPMPTATVMPTAIITPTATPIPTVTPTATPVPTVTPTPTAKPTTNQIPSSAYGGYKFTSKEGRQSQYSYYYINCGMNDSPLGEYSSYNGTITLSYNVYNPSDETIRIDFHVQTNYNNFWCYMYPRNNSIVSIAPGATKTVTTAIPIENGNISFYSKGSVVKINAEKAFLRFDVYFSDMEKAGNQVVIFANSTDDVILNCDWYSTGYMIPERIY